jgi:hypothetical protein
MENQIPSADAVAFQTVGAKRKKGGETKSRFPKTTPTSQPEKRRVRIVNPTQPAEAVDQGNHPLRIISKPRTSRIFLTRLAPEVSSQEIRKFVKDKMNIDPVDCIKLPTRYETYSSFCLEIFHQDFETVYNSDEWPPGLFLKRFRGGKAPKAGVPIQENQA